MRAAAYMRVSSDGQVDNTSLDVQRGQIQAYSSLKGIELAAEFSDPGISGFKPIADRPEGAKLTALVESGAIEAVIIVKLDRAFRNTVDCLQSVEEWEARNVALHIVDLGGNSIDTTSPAGRFMLTVIAAAAEMERGIIRDRCNSGRRARMAQGCRGGEIPYGWDLESPITKRLVKNPLEQNVIRDIVLLNEEGLSLRAISDELARRGLTSKKGGRWTPMQVSRIIKRNAA
jgi:site-specific DNA recombinase